MKEAIKMNKKIVKVFEELGLIAEWEARAEERKSFSIAQNLVKLGIPIETVISATQLDPEKVKTMYQQVNAN
jgi:predicted transposase YdaD